VPTVPYISAAAFAAHPTYMDLDDLRNGSSSPADQTAELTNLLLMASQWADDQCNLPRGLGAHTVTQQTRARVDRAGNLKIHPDDVPLLGVSSLAYGHTPTALTDVDVSQAWVEDGRNVVLPLGGGGPWSGALQFGTPVSGGEVFVRFTYTAGFVATVLTADTTAGATSLTVADPTGILPGSSYRLWEPGQEETVTVSPSWTPPAAGVPVQPTVVTLAGPTLKDHMAGHDFSGMPSVLRLAVTNYTVSLLMRPDTAAEDAYPDTQLSAGTRQNDPRRDGSGLVAEAERILSTYARVR
jgi:hypothetical protein